MQHLARRSSEGTLTILDAPGSLLPPGLTLNSSSGAIGGTPPTVGAYSFTVPATDSASNVDAANFTVSFYSFCDLKGGGATTVSDVQQIINEALGGLPAVHDLNSDGVVNVVDIQLDINGTLGLGCSASAA